MIEHLSTLIEDFPGAANQTHCFTHILNLVAKSILCQFEPRKKTADSENEDVDDATKALATLAQELELEDSADDPEEGLDVDEDLEVDDDDDDDDDDGLGDEHDGMSEEDVAELEESLVPIRLMLTKVCQPFQTQFRKYLIIYCIASCTCIHDQELIHHYPPSMARKA